jgi:hypothetical protein
MIHGQGHPWVIGISGECLIARQLHSRLANKILTDRSGSFLLEAHDSTTCSTAIGSGAFSENMASPLSLLDKLQG